jgi:hypothetical protein
VDPDTPRFSIFVGGLSNAWVLVDGEAKAPHGRRKTLRLNFKRVDGKAVFVPPAEWVYRLSKRDVPAQRKKERPEPAHEGDRDLRGKILKAEGKHLLLSVGSDDGVRRGEKLEVFRLRPQPVYLGRVEILEVTPHSSVARPVAPFARGDSPRAGDEVARQIR